MWKLNLNSFFLSNFEKKFGRLQILLREKTGFCDDIFRDKLYLQFVCLFVCLCSFWNGIHAIPLKWYFALLGQFT